MGIAPLTVAAIAGALLILSVGVDLAFTQTISLEAGKSGDPLQLLGESRLAGRDTRYQGTSDPIDLNRSDTLDLRVRLVNAYPWPSTKAITISTEGCYTGAAPLALVDVRAPARGVGDATAQVSVSKVLDASFRFAPKPVAEVGRTMPISLTLCRGNVDLLYTSLQIREVSS